MSPVATRALATVQADATGANALSVISSDWMFESSPDCLKVLDLDGALLAMNRNGQCVMEIDAFEALIGHPWPSLWPEESRAMVVDAIASARAGTTGHFDAYCPTAKGTPRWWDVMVSPIRDDRGQVVRLLSVSRDVTALHQAKEDLRATAARLEFTLSAAQVGDWDLDLTTDTARRSLRHDECFGYTAPVAQWGFETFLAHVHSDDRDRVRALFQDVLRAGHDWNFDCRVIWPDASVHWIAVHASVYRALSGAPERLLGIVFDITARKHGEEDLRRLAAELSEANHRKTEFLATLAHELRNPLAPIRSGLEVISRAGNDSSRLARVRDMMDRQVSHMVRLVDDLLDVARITRGKIKLKKTRLDLHSVLASAVETVLPVIEVNQQTLRQSIAAEALPLDADGTRIAQVVSNLLNNAAKYTPQGGHIALDAHREDDFVVISVTDNGVGIPAESLAMVFEMFTQLSPHHDRAQGGLGIGLTLVRRLVELHGGVVHASSPGAGRGSTFVVRLPLAAMTDSVVESDSGAASVPALASLKLLVVDDNVDAAESLGAILELEGHQVRTAHDGHQAVRVASAFEPDVIFLDIGMPGMNGYETARALRRTPELEDVVLVALTGWGTDHDRVRAAEAGFDHHLTKPSEFAAVEALLATIARRAAASPG